LVGGGGAELSKRDAGGVGGTGVERWLRCVIGSWADRERVVHCDSPVALIVDGVFGS
jgi:hypothetical protein